MKKAGFILASNLLALAIINLAIAFCLINYREYRLQKIKMDENLEAARLCQETADAVYITGKPVRMHRKNLVSEGNHQRIIVERSGQQVLALWLI